MDEGVKSSEGVNKKALGLFCSQEERGIGEFEYFRRQEIGGRSKSDQSKGSADSDDERPIQGMNEHLASQNCYDQNKAAHENLADSL